MFKYEINDSSFLALLETNDAEQLYELINRNRDHIGKWLKFPSITLGPEDSKSFIVRTRMRYAKDEGHWLGIWSKNKLVGSIGYLYLD